MAVQVDQQQRVVRHHVHQDAFRGRGVLLVQHARQGRDLHRRSVSFTEISQWKSSRKCFLKIPQRGLPQAQHGLARVVPRQGLRQRRRDRHLPQEGHVGGGHGGFDGSAAGLREGLGLRVQGSRAGV